MHIPDGFLSAPVCAVMGLLALAVLAIVLKQVERRFDERTVPLMGVSAAFIFAAQMINFPVLGGTSGHLLGGTLAAVLLGPWAGTLSVMVVFLVQAFLFQDGGILALGANMFNMGFIGTFLGYHLYRAVRTLLGNKGTVAILAATAVSSWVSVVVAAAAAAFELALSGTTPLVAVLPAMLGVHVLIGVGEAVLTVGVIGFLLRTRPDLLYEPREGDTSHAP